MFLPRTPLFDAAGAGGAGGGGTPNPLTPEEVTKLVTPIIQSTINDAVANFKKGDLPKLIAGELTTQITPIKTTLDGFTEKLEKLVTGGSGSGGSGGTGGGTGGAGGSGSGGGTGTGNDPNMNAEILSLKRNQESLQKKLDDAETNRKAAEARAELTDRHSRLRAMLGKFRFADAEAAGGVFDLFAGRVVRGENGDQLIVKTPGGDLPAEQFVDDYVTQHLKGLLAPADAGGTGAGAGAGKGKGSVQLEDIRPGAKREDLQKAATEVAALARTALGGS
jgi:hypothetical protein